MSDLKDIESRHIAEVVAITNLVLQCVCLVSTVAFATRLVLSYRRVQITAATDVAPNGVTVTTTRTFIALLWTLMASATILGITKVSAAVLLLQGTQAGIEVSLALKYCLVWKTVTIVFLMFQALSILFTRVTYPSFINGLFCIMDGTFLYFVFSYTNELSSFQ